METEKDKRLLPVLTDEEEDFLQTIKQDYEKSRWIRLSGIFTFLLGIGLGASTYFTEGNDIFLLVGLFFACIGLLALRDISRTQKLYEILKKFLPSNMEL